MSSGALVICAASFHAWVDHADPKEHRRCPSGPGRPPILTGALALQVSGMGVTRTGTAVA